MKLIDSFDPNIRVAVELNGQELADLLELFGRISPWLRPRDRNPVPRVTRTTQELHNLIAGLYRKYKFPDAGSLQDLYIHNNMVCRPRDEEQAERQAVNIQFGAIQPVQLEVEARPDVVVRRAPADEIDF